MPSNTINQGAAGGIIIQPTWGTVEAGGLSGGSGDNFDAILKELRTYLDAKADKADVYSKDETYSKSEVYNKTETYSQTALDTLFAGKSNIGHDHDDRYYTETEMDTLLSSKSNTSHIHDDRYYIESEIDTLLSGKSNTNHTHDDRYYTESEVDTKLGGKSNTGHTHDDRYYTESETDTKLNAKLNLSGGTMTGQIATSFKSAIAMGSRQADATTIPNLVNEVRYSSGGAGSINLTTAYTNNNITIPTGWYNYIYSPHRSGGSSGAASGDNHNYGTLLLYGMTMNAGPFAIRIASGSIAALFCISRHYYGTGGMTDGTTALPAGTVYYQY